MQTFDSPWKQISDTFFQEMIRFYYPKAARGIDWSKPIRCLDKELHKLSPEGKTGHREADKLVEVHRKKGDTRLVYIHIEFQNQRDPDLAERIFDKYRKPVWSMVILGDMDRRYRPDTYVTELWDLCLSLRYPTIKLRDYEADFGKLLRSSNPFALVTAAHLLAQRTRKKPYERLQQKLTLTKLLLRKRYTKQQIIALFDFIDWVLQLSPTLTKQFTQALAAFEGNKKMAYITSIERLGYDRGQKDGLKKGRQETQQQLRHSFAQDFIDMFTTRFGEPTPQYRELIEQAEIDQIRSWNKQIVACQSLDELFGGR